jgi:chemotaxis protein CheZ
MLEHPAGAAAPTASERLAAIGARYPGADPAMVAEVVRSILETMSGDLTSYEARMLHEVEELGQTIASARAEIAALKVDDITASHIPTASDELDAIVAHTAAATDAILEVCETLDRVGAGLQGDGAAALQDATTRIYEACSFQDITGQRISKVVGALKSIDSKVAHMLTTFGVATRGRDSVSATLAAPHRATTDAGGTVPMHGPQLATAAMDQSDIDKLLASFD